MRFRGEPARTYSVTATFKYGDVQHTLVARTQADAYADAILRWGAGWDGEPVFSTPASIHRDITGQTKREHGRGVVS
jgi:hypothetical protein